MMTAAGIVFGQNPGGDSPRLAESSAEIACDTVTLLVESAMAGGTNGPGDHQGRRKAGPAIPPAMNFVNGLTASNPVVTAAGLDLQYLDSCSCLRYVNTTLRRF